MIMRENAAAMAEAMLGAGSALHIIATSRERLRAEGEWVYPVQPLTAPAADVAADDDSCAMAPFGCSQRGRERQGRVLRRTGT
jgi:predicted ATPase